MVLAWWMFVEVPKRVEGGARCPYTRVSDLTFEHSIEVGSAMTDTALEVCACPSPCVAASGV
jgi:hypothetical protein